MPGGNEASGWSGASALEGAEYSAPLDLSDALAIDQLRRILEAHDYSETGLQRALGQADGRALPREDLPLYLKRLSVRSPLHTLIKLFALHTLVPADEAREAFVPLTLDQVAALGVVELGSDAVRARVALALCDGLWLAHDFPELAGVSMASDHVAGLHPTSPMLAALTVWRPGGRVLDLGAGCGVQGLLEARRSRRVIVVGSNPRALNFAAFNARLNRLANFECRLGNLFEPVAGQRFDLIVCNRPEILSPAHHHGHDGGLPGDRVCRQIVRAAARYLHEGGFACLLCAWGHRQEDPWSKCPREWVAPSGCDALLFLAATQDPIAYAKAWLLPTAAADYRATLDRWCDYCRRRGFEALSVGGVVLRRRVAPPPLGVD